MRPTRTRRWALAATPILAAHLGLGLLIADQTPAAPQAPEPPLVMVELVDPPAPPPPPPPARIIAPEPSPKPDAPAAGASAAPPKPAPQRRPPAVAAARPRPVVAKRPPDVDPLPVAPAPPGPPLPLLGPAEVAGALTAGAGPGGGGQGSGAGVGGPGGTGTGRGGGSCDMVRWVQDAVRDDVAVRRAVIDAAQSMNASGRAILVWNGDWLQSRNQSGKGLAGVRQAIALEVAFAPAECKSQRMTGLAVLKLEDRPGGAQLALGKGSWRWSDLLGAG
ncbi:hypothetical protein [Brevundimonas sp.]|uniref:hypothetical protein n=1 Tax=Brevundimonas sp. TaxID=1871086 RepID=UPI00289E681D|nr:hypothetical protein [Brevundimonas sp.]